MQNLLLSHETTESVAIPENPDAIPPSQEVVDAQFASIIEEIDDQYDNLPQHEQEEIVNVPFMYKRDGVIDLLHKRQGK